MIWRTAGGQSRGRDGRADDEILGSVEDQSAVGHLARGEIDLRLALAFQPTHVDVADDANNRALAKRDEELSPDRVLVGEHLVRE